MNTDPWLVGAALLLTIGLLLAIGWVISEFKKFRKR